MQRVLSANFPNWSIDLLARRDRRRRHLEEARRAPDVPRAVLLTNTVGGRQIVVGCCAPARSCGVRVGLAVAEARALLAGHAMRCEPHDPERERGALRALAIWARRFSPLVSEDAPAGLLLDIAGCERLFGGEARLLDALVEALQALGLQTRVAVADTVGCAWALARHGASVRTCVDSGEERAALAPLPVAALRLDEAVHQHLFEVGIERIEHLFALARDQLFARFGAEVLLRLDQATGHAFEPVRAVTVAEVPRVERVFHGPVLNLELLFDVVRTLAEELVAALRDQEAGARRVDLLFQRVDAPAIRRTIVLTRPTVDAAHLWALLRPKVEAANLGYGIERLELTASHVASLHHRQRPMLAEMVAEGDPQDLDHETGELLDVLVERCGHDRVLRAERVDSHVPEHALRARSVLEPAARSTRTPTPARHPDRPSVLFERPDPIEMIVVRSDGSPAWLRWRGTECRVLSVRGPERIGAPWWRTTRRRPAPRSESPEAPHALERCLAHRDYYKVQDDRGRWLWVFHGLDSRRWFVHGEWA